MRMYLITVNDKRGRLDCEWIAGYSNAASDAVKIIIEALKSLGFDEKLIFSKWYWDDDVFVRIYYGSENDPDFYVKVAPCKAITKDSFASKVWFAYGSRYPDLNKKEENEDVSDNHQ